jgi:hypothetical protein
MIERIPVKENERAFSRSGDQGLKLRSVLTPAESIHGMLLEAPNSLYGFGLRPLS